MKSKFLKLNKACSEQWEQMKLNEKGSFCETCAKNVIDFTQLSPIEISEKIKNAKGEICARVTKQQLAIPLVDLETQKTYKLPYSNVAASILLASTLAVSTSAQAQQKSEKPATEFVESTTVTPKSKIKRNYSKLQKTTSSDFITFTGIVNNTENMPVPSAKITLVTLQKMISTRSLMDGTFSLEIPVELLDDANVIRVEYEEEKAKDGKRSFEVYDTEDYVLSKKEMTSAYHITAKPIVYYLGGIGFHREKNPIVIQNGKRIPYKDFQKARRGKKSSCSLENKDTYYFESEVAVAIYGKGAETGLYILKEKE